MPSFGRNKNNIFILQTRNAFNYMLVSSTKKTKLGRQFLTFFFTWCCSFCFMLHFYSDDSRLTILNLCPFLLQTNMLSTRIFFQPSISIGSFRNNESSFYKTCAFCPHTKSATNLILSWFASNAPNLHEIILSFTSTNHSFTNAVKLFYFFLILQFRKNNISSENFF